MSSAQSRLGYSGCLINHISDGYLQYTPAAENYRTSGVSVAEACAYLHNLAAERNCF